MRYMTDKETVSEEDYQRMLVEEGMRKEEEMIRQNAKMEARQAREAAKQAREAAKQAREVAKQAREEAKQAREVAKQAEQEARLKAKGPMARLKWQQDKVARDTRKESEGKRKQSQLHLRREKARKKRIAEEAARITKEAAQLAATQFASFQLAVSQQQTSFIVPMKNRASFQKLQTHSVPISGSLEERRQKTLPKAVAYSKAMTLLQYVRQMEEKSSSPRKLNRVKKRAVKSKRKTGSNRQFLNPNSIKKIPSLSSLFPKTLEQMESDDFKSEIAVEGVHEEGDSPIGESDEPIGDVSADPLDQPNTI